MTFLLAACNAKYVHTSLAVYSLRAYAREHAGDILIREYTINQNPDQVLADIYETGADVICFSCYIWNISFIRSLLGDLKKVLPESQFWAGGPEVSFDPETVLLENPALTGVMVGEGEATFLDLVKYYRNGEGILSRIPGIVWREGEEIHTNPARDPLDMNLLPFPWPLDMDFSHRMAYYESSRGCPFSCSYCLSSVEKFLRFRDLHLVCRELDYFLGKEVPRVKFVDRTFNCRPSRAREIWTYIRDNDNGVTNFHFEIAGDLLEEQDLELLSTLRPGLVQLEIGVQSSNPRTLQAVNRVTDLERLSRNVRKIHSFRNIHQHLDLIAGLPFEDFESFQRSFDFVYALEPDQLQLGFLKVLKGSPMEEQGKKWGFLWREDPPYEILSTPWIGYGEIRRLKTVESMVEIYYNTRQFDTTLRDLIPLFPDAFSFYEALGNFYRERGYDEISHSRIRRYEILLEFALTLGDISREKVTEDLLIDLYLRENLKSRPSFAPEQKVSGKVLRRYLKSRGLENGHVEVLGSGKALLFDYERRDPLTGNARVEDLNMDFLTMH